MKTEEGHEYNLQVSLTPHPWDNPKQPYFWWVSDTFFKNEESVTCNTGCCGWGESPEKAWEEGLTTWNKWLMFD